MVAIAGKHQYTLVIDAGHGGKDAGALGKRAKEKDINLNVALAFGRYVEQNCPDVKVIYTRKNDVFIPLHERAAIANRNKADVFISIHTNSVASRKPVTGLETYTMGVRRSDEKLSAAMRENDVVLIEKDFQQHYAGFDPRSPESYIIFEVLNDANMLESVELAKKIQKNVCRTASRPDKGVKQDAFLVLRETSMPACLIELGYISTPSEEAYLTDRRNVDAMGRGIYQAFVEFKNGHGTTPQVTSAAPVAPETPEVPAVPEVPATQTTQGTSENSGTQSNSGISETPAPPAPADTQNDAPVFKVQFLACERQLRAGDSRLKGLTGTDCYKEGNLWKYTIGASVNYPEIRDLRKEVAQKFPQAFIVAFKNGERMDTQTAIREYQQKKSSK